MTGSAEDLVARYTRPDIPPGARALAATALIAPTVAVFALFFAALLHLGALYIVAGLAALLTYGAVRGYRRKVPPELRRAINELVVPAPEAHETSEPNARTFEPRRNLRLQLDPDGLTVDRRLTTRRSAGLNSEGDAPLRVPWSRVEQWIVNAANDGPNVYELVLDGGDRFSILRPTSTAEAEAELLDTVQRIGRCPVVIRADLTRR